MDEDNGEASGPHEGASDDEPCPPGAAGAEISIQECQMDEVSNKQENNLNWFWGTTYD